jgi:phosphatidylglycerophosphatase A|tara:strand:- start:124 stop:618 length:495 start_codon:yes stop_codon:yes gene_type:complete
MFKKINILILSMFFIGYSKYAPGTVASFLTSLIYVFFYNFQINFILLILIIVLIFIFSVYSIDFFKNSFDNIDAKEIVIDEFVGQSIPLLTIYSIVPKENIEIFLPYVLISFISFRFFDILKIYPANIVDKKMKNGFGVMLDDVIAGFYSAVVILFIFVFGYYE